MVKWWPRNWNIVWSHRLTVLSCSTYLSWYPASPLFDIDKCRTVCSPTAPRVNTSLKTLAKIWDTSCERPEEGLCKCIGGSTSTSWTWAIAEKTTEYQDKIKSCYEDRHFVSLSWILCPLGPGTGSWGLCVAIYVGLDEVFAEARWTNFARITKLAYKKTFLANLGTPKTQETKSDGTKGFFRYFTHL